MFDRLPATVGPETATGGPGPNKYWRMHRKSARWTNSTVIYSMFLDLQNYRPVDTVDPVGE